jgi:hypothetical protein
VRIQFDGHPSLGSGTLQTAIHVLRYVNIVAYIALGIVTLRFWRQRRDRASMWAAIAFGDLALLEIFALVPNARSGASSSR